MVVCYVHLAAKRCIKRRKEARLSKGSEKA
jgi:hypothetical protein